MKLSSRILTGLIAIFLILIPFAYARVDYPQAKNMLMII